MELQGDNGSVVELAGSVEKELGRGPGVAPHDRTVSRRQVRLIADCFGFTVSIEVIGANPICVVRCNGREGAKEEVEIVKSGARSLLEVGDKFSLSIQEPVFYTLQKLVARVGLGPHRSEPRRNGKLPGHDQNDKRDEGEGVGAGIAAADPDEEEGIAEAVARWQRRKHERLQRPTQERGATVDGISSQVEEEREQAEDVISEPDLVFSQHDLPVADALGLTGGPRAHDDDTHPVTKFGFIVEGLEFERFGKKALDTSKWDWQIGRRSENDCDEEEEGRRVSNGQIGKHSRNTAGSKANQKVKRAKADDDDDWQGDSEGEKELLSTGERPVSRKKDVQTRSHDLATTSGTVSEPRKKPKLVSTSVNGPATISSTKKVTKRKSREMDEEDEGDDGEDLDGFLVDDVEEEDESEAADDEDEWTDENEDEEVEEDDEIDEGRSKGTARLAGTSRPVEDNELDQGDGRPLCKYGNKCFRKNKEHLAEFQH